MVRIEALPQDAQELLRVLAAGRGLDHALLAEASAAWSRARCARRCARRSASHVVDGRRGGHYAFRHALLREVVHDDLLPGEHAELHLRARARARAPHAGAGRQRAGSPRASPTTTCPPATSRRRFAAAVRAADAAEEVHAHGEAARLLERALELWSRVPDAEALAGIDHADAAAPGRHARTTTGRRGRGAARGGARARSTRPPSRYRAAELLERLANVRWGLGPPSASAGHARARPRAAARRRRSPERALLLGLRAKFLMLRGRHRSAVAGGRARR